MRNPLFLMVLLALASCKSIKDVAQDHPNFITINNRGMAMSEITSQQRSSKNNHSQYDDQLNRLFLDVEKFRTERKSDKIVIYIHGGLNGLAGSHKYSVAANCEMRNEGYYPIFINWLTGLVSSYDQHIRKIRRGEEYNVMGYFSGLFYFGTDYSRGLANFPIQHINAVTRVSQRYVSGWNINRNNCEKIYQFMNNPATPGAKINLIGNPHDGKSKYPSKWTSVDKFHKKFLALWHSPITYPFVDGMGTEAWINMSRRVKVMFRPHKVFDIRNVHNGHMNSLDEAINESEASGAAALFFKALSQYKKTHPEVSITLVGHSMGSMVANEAIRLFGDDLEIDNLVYMAAACKISDWEEAVVPYMKKTPKTQFYNLTLHPDAEIDETFFPFVPTGSLLEWIDTFFGLPETFQDRTMGKYENFMQTIPIIPQNLRPRITLKVFDYTKSKDDAPRVHGGFKKFRFWKPDFYSGRLGLKDDLLKPFYK